MKTKKCPACGSYNIGKGLLSGYANMVACKANGKASIRSSSVQAEVCGDCGLIINLYVTKPEKFPRQEDIL